MLSVATRYFSRRDVALLAAGAFAALSLVGLHSTILKHGKVLSSVPPLQNESGFYEDWFSEELTPFPTFEENEAEDGHGSVRNSTFLGPNRHSNSSSGPLLDGVLSPEGNAGPLQGSSPATKKGCPSTRVINHAPGWTMFENLYMSNGTLFIVTSPQDNPNPLGLDRGMAKVGWEHGLPLRRMMTSTGAPGYATEKSALEREPTDKDMLFISSEEAQQRWADQIWEIDGRTWLSNDPSQFLGHFYASSLFRFDTLVTNCAYQHFVAETLLGFWAFYAGTLGPSITALGETTVPPPARAIFLRCTTSDIRDHSKFNSFYLKAAFPSMTVETSPDWADRVFMTRNGNQAWRFSHVLLADRSASFRAKLVGQEFQRIAAAALNAVEDKISRWWWEPVRRAVLRVANVPEDLINMAINSAAAFDPHLATANGMVTKDRPIVITYINRQGGKTRSLAKGDHERLVEELTAVSHRREWELHDIKAQNLAQEEQLTIAAKTTIMVGVHGNGLSHLLSMAPTRLSTVIEIFNKPGFTHDYGWTARTLGYRYYAIWNDTVFQYPDLPPPQVSEGFQSTSIPVYAPLVSRLIEERADEVQI